MGRGLQSIRVCMMVTNDVTHDSRVLREAETLRNLGLQVCIMGMAQKGTSPFQEERGGVQIRRCRRWKVSSWLEKRWGGIGGIVDKALESLQYLFFSLRAKGDIFHSHDLDTLLFAYVAARRCRAKLIYDSHELYLEQWTGGSLPPLSPLFLPLLRSLEAFLIRRTYATITVNESIAGELASRYSIARPLILRNCASLSGGDSASFLRTLPGIRGSDRIVLHTGSLNARGRALQELVLACKRVRPDIHLVFLGDGPAKGTLKELVRHEGLEERVHFLDPVPPDRIIATMKGADLAMVLMKAEGSLNNLFSLPNKLFEAIAAEIPVVASDLPEIRRMVLGYKIGILCQPEDPDHIAKAIEEALKIDRYASFKENLKCARNDLNWEKESQKLIALYQEIIKV